MESLTPKTDRGAETIMNLQNALKEAAAEMDRRYLMGAAAAERARLFVAIRHGIPLDKPWRGEALDLISKILADSGVSVPGRSKNTTQGDGNG